MCFFLKKRQKSGVGEIWRRLNKPMMDVVSCKMLK